MEGWVCLRGTSFPVGGCSAAPCACGGEGEELPHRLAGPSQGAHRVSQVHTWEFPWGCVGVHSQVTLKVYLRPPHRGFL